MHFEVSITVLYVVVLACLGLSVIWPSILKLVFSKRTILVSTFLILAALSLLWTMNPLRGLLTLGLMGLLYIIYLATVRSYEKIYKLIPLIVNLLILSSVIMSILSVVQMIAGIWLDRSSSLLCLGCTTSQFGFARPNLFTIEPQFLGSILLIPALILSYELIKKKTERKHGGLILLIITTALLITLSRGAIYAFLAGLTVILITSANNLTKILRVLAILSASLITCLLVQASTAAINPDIDITFLGAANSSVNQLSLGQLEIPRASKPHSKNESAALDGSNHKTRESSVVPENHSSKPAFDGYVEESTNTRLRLSTLGIDAWNDNLPRIIFGAGIGSSGSVLSESFPSQIGKREIVQNQYVEILLENGILGVFIFLSILFFLFMRLISRKWLWGILVAFLVQWNFFSGLPNAIHIYLTLIMLAVIVYSQLSKIKKLNVT